MSTPIFDKKVRSKKKFNKFEKWMASPMRRLGIRPVNVDFILNRQDYI